MLKDSYENMIKKMRYKLKNSDYVGSYKYLRKLFKLNPRDNVVKFELAKIIYYNYPEKLDVAYRYFNEIYDYNHYAAAKLYSGRIMIKRKQFDDACKCFIELFGTECEVDALIELARYEEYIGNLTSARQYYILASEKKKVKVK